MKKYAILGYPLKHSFSPTIHNSAFTYLKLEAEYVKHEIDPACFDKSIDQIKKENWDGFNITIPFKQDIIRHLDFIDPLAERIGAVNTVHINERGKWRGYNTDYWGFIKPLLDLDINPESCLILGAGGAARAVAFGLAENFNVDKIVFVNRTAKKAVKLIQDLKKYYDITFSVETTEKQVQKNEAFDLIANTTSVGMGNLAGQFVLSPSLVTHKQSVVYDLIYNPQTTRFLELAKKENLVTINGLAMLIYQAALSFNIWTDLDFPESVVHSLIKELPSQTERGNTLK